MARNPLPYTFSLYANGDLLTNVYGEYGGDPLGAEGVCNGVAPTKELACSRAAALGSRVAWKGSIDVIVWRHGRAVYRGDLSLFVSECAA